MSALSENKNIIDQIGQQEGFAVLEASSLSGGSINEVFHLKTSTGDQVLKLNSSTEFPGMFEAEKKGLEALKATGTFEVPKVFSFGAIGTQAYLLLEYQAPGKKSEAFWETFAQNLTDLHRHSAAEFAFPASNYIGSLPQYNQHKDSAAEYYITQRLEPQLKMATENGFSFKNLELIFKNIASAIPEEKPALVHGDLWGGNYLVNDKGLPCLIDPAVSYAPREMDLAMMKLFGGFPEEVFHHYFQQFPVSQNFGERIPLWQLYYLLVHLNIFGSSYLPSVTTILRSYS